MEDQPDWQPAKSVPKPISHDFSELMGVKNNRQHCNSLSWRPAKQPTARDHSSPGAHSSLSIGSVNRAFQSH